MTTNTSGSGPTPGERFRNALDPGPGEFSGGSGAELGARAALRRGLPAPSPAAGGYSGAIAGSTLHDATESRARLLAGQPTNGDYWERNHG